MVTEFRARGPSPAPPDSGAATKARTAAGRIGLRHFGLSPYYRRHKQNKKTIAKSH
jgi:hypothetical protein